MASFIKGNKLFILGTSIVTQWKSYRYELNGL
jgi:hypothetical protein